MRRLRLKGSWWFAQVHGGSWHFIWRELWFYLLYFLCFCSRIFTVCVLSHSVMSDSVTPWTVACSLLCPWNSLGKNTAVGCQCLSGGSSQPRARTQVSCIAGRFFIVLERTVFVFSTLGENKTKMKKCIPHIQLCLSAHLDFTERNSNEFLLFSLGKAKRGCPAHEVIVMPLSQLWSEISAL